VLPPAAELFRLPGIPQASSRRARLRRHPRVLRTPQLDGWLARHGDAAAAGDLRRSRRLRASPPLLLRLPREPPRLRPLDGAARPRGDAALEGSRAEIDERRRKRGGRG